MTNRRLRLDRETLAELAPDTLQRIQGGATNPSCVRLLCAVESTEGCDTLLVPCHQSSQCSHPCA